MAAREQLTFALPQPVPTLQRLWTPAEIFERLDKENLGHFLEDRRVERKSARIQPKAVSEYLSMWANTSPHGGLIFIGVENNGQITGCNGQSIQHMNSLEFYSELCPDARIEIRDIEAINSHGKKDYVLAIKVAFRTDKLVELSNGDAFIREGDNKVKLSEVVKQEIRIARGEIHYELEKVPLRYPADFDIEEIKKFCESYARNRRIRTAKTVEETLELAKLGKRDGRNFLPNLACALLFATDPRDIVPGARIRVIRYEGTQEGAGSNLNVVFSTFVDGNISRLLPEAKATVASQLRSFQRYESTGKLAIREEYPEEAWFEAIVNAVAHRSYNLKTQNIFVRIFDDRLVVESPGGFVPPTTADTIYGSHNPRNPFLMDALMHLEFTFCSFEGTARMRQAMNEAKLPSPRFRQIENLNYQVHVVLENDVAARRTEAVSEPSFVLPPDIMMGLTKDERAVMSVLARASTVNITLASLVTEKSWPTAQRVVQGLVDRGILVPAEARRKHDSAKSYTVPGRA